LPVLVITSSPVSRLQEFMRPSQRVVRRVSGAQETAAWNAGLAGDNDRFAFGKRSPFVSETARFSIVRRRTRDSMRRS
jgi:hypothetical protein